TEANIHKNWNADKLFTPHPSGKTHEWTAGTVRNYFLRPRLFGYQEYDGVLYPLKDWKPLMTKDEFDAVQTIIDSKRTGKRGVSYGRGDSHLLTKIAICECGRGMNVAYRGGAGSAKIYKCPTAKHQTVAGLALEKHVSIHVLNLLHVADNLEDNKGEAQDKVRELRNKRTELETHHREWLKQAGAAGLDPMVIRSRMTAHADYAATVDAELFQAEQERGLEIFPAGGMEILPAAGDEPDDLSNWKSVPVPKRRELIKSVVDHVRIARGQQGARFKPERIFYVYTPRGERLAEIWYEKVLSAVEKSTK
ncbi:recombinase family protein, partial [Brevibacterium aurantiacum]|uniref:recombinase family protein n=1 Tax=Brevibacterium aurantiacum TaxID=273384 RepID=UPI00196A565B